MTYKNAKDVLPQRLLSELWQYADGELLYIPSKPAQKNGWGDKSGARQQYAERNRQIRSLYETENFSHQQLSEKFYLSVDTIKKILRS